MFVSWRELGGECGSHAGCPLNGGGCMRGQQPMCHRPCASPGALHLPEAELLGGLRQARLFQPLTITRGSARGPTKANMTQAFQTEASFSD